MVLRPQKIPSSKKRACVGYLGRRQDQRAQLWWLGKRFHALVTHIRIADIVLLNRPDHPPVGGSETPITAIAPAIASAIYNAFGKRCRSMPVQL
jgi:hypothetical protein